MNTQFIILAAGKGTRMNSALPKVLVNLGGKPMIQHLLDHIKTVDILLPPVVVVGHKYELVQSYLGSKDYVYAFQEGQFGTAHAVKAGLEKAEADNVIVLYGDMPFIQASTIERLMELHEKTRAKFSMLTTTVPEFENEYKSMQGFGRIIRDEQGNLLRICELLDASETERQIREVNPGIYMFDAAWIKTNIERISKNKHNEFFLTDIVEVAIQSAVKIETTEVSPLQVIGINTPRELEQAQQLLRD